MARPMPVLPEVPSTIVPPGFRRPARSASSIILTAIRSLIELPGLNVSSFTSTVPLTTPFVIRLMRTIGVSPIASRIVSQIFFTRSSLYSSRETARHAQTHPRTDGRRGRRHEAEEDRGVRRARELGPCEPQRGADDVAGGLGGAGAAAGVRGDHARAARRAARRARERRARRARRAGGGHRGGRVGPLQHAVCGRRGVHRRLPPGVLAGDGAPRRVTRRGAAGTAGRYRDTPGAARSSSPPKGIGSFKWYGSS